MGGDPLTNPVRPLCNTYVRRALESARELIILADEGEAHASDDGCAVLFGVVRDCAYKIRTQAEREKENHQSAGAWDDPPLSTCETPQ